MKQPPLPSIGRSRDQVLTARRVLIGIGIFFASIGIFLLFNDLLFDAGVGSLLFAMVFLTIALFSRKYPKAMFLVGTILGALLVLSNLVRASILGASIMGVLTKMLYHGWEAAKYLDTQATPVLEDDDILDAGMWEEK